MTNEVVKSSTVFDVESLMSEINCVQDEKSKKQLINEAKSCKAYFSTLTQTINDLEVEKKELAKNIDDLRTENQKLDRMLNIANRNVAEVSKPANVNRSIARIVDKQRNDIETMNAAVIPSNSFIMSYTTFATSLFSAIICTLVCVLMLIYHLN